MAQKTMGSGMGGFVSVIILVILSAVAVEFILELRKGEQQTKREINMSSNPFSRVPTEQDMKTFRKNLDAYNEKQLLCAHSHVQFFHQEFVPDGDITERCLDCGLFITRPATADEIRENKEKLSRRFTM